MAYTRTVWVLGLAGGTALNASHLNNMEQGIADAHSMIADLAAAHHTHVSADITDATASNTINTIVKRDATGFIAVSGITGLSTATGSTQAVPKQQLDDAIATLAGTSHTHTVSQITDITTAGANLVKAADNVTQRTVLDVPSNSEMSTSIATAVAGAATPASVTAAISTSEAYTDTVTSGGAYVNKYAGSQWPVRQDTSTNLRTVLWIGPAATPIPYDGTTSGGTRKAAPGDLVFYY